MLNSIHRTGRKRYISGNAVPVALCLVGNGMGILSDTYVLYTIIYLDCYCVFPAYFDMVSHIIYMRSRKSNLMPYFLTIDIYGCLDMRTFKSENDTLFPPFLWHKHLSAIPRIANVVAIRSKEERELHLSLNAVFLHIGIEIERGIIQRACPLCFHGNDIALVLRNHGAWQLDSIVINRYWRNGILATLNLKLPSSRKIYLVLGGSRKDRCKSY